MTTCASKEIVSSIIVNNPGTTATPVAAGTNEIKFMTVYNETDQIVKVLYADRGGSSSFFHVPANGRSFTRVLNTLLNNDTLKIQSVGSVAAGNVIFNFGN